MDISVVIPTFNRARFLKKTIDSALNQTIKNYEIIIVDDGSSDNTKQIVESYGDKIKYIYQKNAGPSAARNTGIKHAKGTYIAFLDSDDEFLPRKLELQMKYLKAHPECRFLYSYYFNVDKKGNILKLREPKECRSKNELRFLLLTRRFTIRTSTVLVHRDVFDDSGYFNTNYSYSQDWDMWLRIIKNCEGHCLKIPLVKYRLHDSNRSSSSIKIYHPEIYRNTMKLYGWNGKKLKKLNKKYGSSKKMIRPIIRVIK